MSAGEDFLLGLTGNGPKEKLASNVKRTQSRFQSQSRDHLFSTPIRLKSRDNSMRLGRTFSAQVSASNPL